MARDKFKKLKAEKNSMIPLHSANEFSWRRGGVRPEMKPQKNFYTEKELKLALKNVGEFNAKMITNYLTLSARTPYDKNKGYLNALNCQSVFPSDPNISFPWWSPQQQSLPTAGKIEIWLTDLQEHQNLTVEMRLTGFSYNSTSAFEVRSSLGGLYGYFPIAVNSKIDLFFPDIELDGSTQALVTIEVNDMDGSWVFFDAKINIVQ
ncbi:MAG: hypothetical protein SGI89_05265 [bacterium]|nr:hypothetical protein [bacterium]